MNSLREYQTLLTRYLADDGGVRYGEWQATPKDVRALSAVLDAWLAKSPESHPESYQSASHRLGYWLNLYNALVIREIVCRWPLESVKDVRPTLLSKVAPLKGFFVDLRFVVGGRTMNLMAIENKIVRAQFKDARIHFALNCGSAACPVLRRTVFDGDALEEQLNEASRDFVNQEENVRVDDTVGVVWLSKLFKWYAGDFERHAAVESAIEGSSLLDFVAYFAEPGLCEALRAAMARGYRVRFHDYDWGVNASSS